MAPSRAGHLPTHITHGREVYISDALNAHVAECVRVYVFLHMPSVWGSPYSSWLLEGDSKASFFSLPYCIPFPELRWLLTQDKWALAHSISWRPVLQPCTFYSVLL